MLFTNTIVLGLAALAAAHPGHEEEERRHAVNARAATASNKRALENCASKLAARGVSDRIAERRKASMEEHRRARGIDVNSPILKRNTTTVLNTDHEGTINATTALDDETYVFDSDNCVVLNPEGEVGPFYVLGEYVRADITDGEPGVPLVVDVQLINVDTCESLADAWVDIWSANSTGVYGGVQSSSNGDGDDASNLNNTALRGIQQTDSDGVVQFTSVFPGHYSGRANHMHIIVHEDATELDNGTLSGGSVSHIGQLFWDQDLITEVEATSPYTENTVTLTTNADDHVFGAQETEDTTSDPVFNYVYFSDDLADGLFTWIVIGVNTSASYTPTYSFELTSSGGEATSSSGGGGGGGSSPF